LYEYTRKRVRLFDTVYSKEDHESGLYKPTEKKVIFLQQKSLLTVAVKEIVRERSYSSETLMTEYPVSTLL
jgi:hypothetical protein